MYQADSSCFSRPSSYGLSLQIRNGTCTPPLLLKQSAYHVCLFVCLLHNIFVPLCAARCGGVRTEIKWNTASNPKWMKKYLNINIKIWISLLYYPVMEFKNGKMACCLLPPPKGKNTSGFIRGRVFCIQLVIQFLLHSQVQLQSKLLFAKLGVIKEEERKES